MSDDDGRVDEDDDNDDDDDGGSDDDESFWIDSDMFCDTLMYRHRRELKTETSSRCPSSSWWSPCQEKQDNNERDTEWTGEIKFTIYVEWDQRQMLHQYPCTYHLRRTETPLTTTTTTTTTKYE